MARVAPRHRQRVADPPRDQRDLKHVGVHRGDGEQPDEAVLDRPVRPGVFAHHHDVRVGAVAQVARDGRLGQHQQIVVVGELRAARRVAAAARPAGSTGRRMPAVAHRAALIAQQHEVSVGEPAQQRGDVAAVVPGKRPSGSVSSASARPTSAACIAPESSATCRASASTLGSSRCASASARRSTDGDSWTWIQVSSMPSRDAPPSAAGPMSSSSPAGPRRTRNTGFMIARRPRRIGAAEPSPSPSASRRGR